MGANQGRVKGNKQKAEYKESGRKAWEIRLERMRKTKEARAEGKHRKMTHCEGESGKKEERKKQRLSSQNRNRSRRKKAEGKGKARRRERKGSTSGTAVGAKLGGMKGNKQKAEYKEPGKRI